MLRRRVYHLFEGPRAGNTAGRVVDAVLVVLIILAVAAALFETEPDITARYADVLTAIEAICGIVFTLEYIVRVWVCPEDRLNRYTHPRRGRLRYMLSTLALIDLVAVLPYWAAVFSPMSIADLWLFRVVRVLKLFRFTAAFDIFAAVIRHERQLLVSGLTIMGVLLVLLSSLMYLIEREAQPDKFGSVPDALWWGIVTLATVGYGDIVPITPLGRLIGGFTVVLGLGLFALPTGILASGFVEETRRRSFVITWNMVASVPFFEHLPAARIAEIADVLIPRVASTGETIVRTGDPADGMYFIARGEVEVLVEPRPVRLHDGDFFGEIALLTDQPRTATVLATTPTQLLLLRTSDFAHLMAAHQDLADEIARVAEARLARAPSPSAAAVRAP